VRARATGKPRAVTRFAAYLAVSARPETRGKGACKNRRSFAFAAPRFATHLAPRLSPRPALRCTAPQARCVGCLGCRSLRLRRRWRRRLRRTDVDFNCPS